MRRSRARTGRPRCSAAIRRRRLPQPGAQRRPGRASAGCKAIVHRDLFSHVRPVKANLCREWWNVIGTIAPIIMKMGVRFMLRSILLAAMVLFAPIAAHSATVTFTYTAVGTVGNPDATVTGTFGYDLSAVDTDSNPDLGIYEGGFLTAKVTRGTQDGGVLSSTDVNFVVNSLSFLTIAAFVDNSGGFAQLQTSRQPPVLSSDALPDATQTLALFNPADGVLIVSDFSLGLSSGVQTGGSAETYRLTSVAQVPLPAGGLLLLSALAGFGLVARRRGRPA